MSDLWLPPSARRNTAQLGDGIEVTPMDGEHLDRMLGPDDAIFLPASRFEFAEWDEPWLATHPFKKLGLSVGGAPRGGPRPGRNQPCPCGSGLKLKRCCGR